MKRVFEASSSELSTNKEQKNAALEQSYYVPCNSEVGHFILESKNFPWNIVLPNGTPLRIDDNNKDLYSIPLQDNNLYDIVSFHFKYVMSSRRISLNVDENFKMFANVLETAKINLTKPVQTQFRFKCIQTLQTGDSTASFKSLIPLDLAKHIMLEFIIPWTVQTYNIKKMSEISTICKGIRILMLPYIVMEDTSSFFCYNIGYSVTSVKYAYRYYSHIPKNLEIEDIESIKSLSFEQPEPESIKEPSTNYVDLSRVRHIHQLSISSNIRKDGILTFVMPNSCDELVLYGFGDKSPSYSHCLNFRNGSDIKKVSLYCKTEITGADIELINILSKCFIIKELTIYIVQSEYTEQIPPKLLASSNIEELSLILTESGIPDSKGYFGYDNFKIPLLKKLTSPTITRTIEQIFQQFPLLNDFTGGISESEIFDKNIWDFYLTPKRLKNLSLDFTPICSTFTGNIKFGPISLTFDQLYESVDRNPSISTNFDSIFGASGFANQLIPFEGIHLKDHTLRYLNLSHEFYGDIIFWNGRIYPLKFSKNETSFQTQVDKFLAIPIGFENLHISWITPNFPNDLKNYKFLSHHNQLVSWLILIQALFDLFDTEKELQIYECLNPKDSIWHIPFELLIFVYNFNEDEFASSGSLQAENPDNCVCLRTIQNLHLFFSIEKLKMLLDHDKLKYSVPDLYRLFYASCRATNSVILAVKSFLEKTPEYRDKFFIVFKKALMNTTTQFLFRRHTHWIYNGQMLLDVFLPVYFEELQVLLFERFVPSFHIEMDIVFQNLVNELLLNIFGRENVENHQIMKTHVPSLSHTFQFICYLYLYVYKTEHHKKDIRLDKFIPYLENPNEHLFLFLVCFLHDIKTRNFSQTQSLSYLADVNIKDHVHYEFFAKILKFVGSLIPLDLFQQLPSFLQHFLCPQFVV